MEKKILGPLLIAVLIFGSMLSMVVLNNNNNDVGPGGPSIEPTPTPPVESPPVAFNARGVDANVFELNSVFPVRGFTSETNILTVENKLTSLGSVDRVLSKQFENPVEGREDFMPVLAELLLSPNIEPAEARAEISTVLSGLEFYRMAVVKIPVGLDAVPEGDANAVSISFAEPFASCIVGSDTLVGDELTIALSFYAQGEIPIRESVRGAMEENITAKPVKKTVFSEANISGISSMFGFDGEFYYAGFDVNSVKQEIESIKNIESVELGLASVQLAFSVSADLTEGDDVNALKADLNSAFMAIDGIERVVFFEGDEFDSRIVYNQLNGYGAVRAQAIAAAETVFEGRIFKFTDPLAELHGSIDLSNSFDLNFTETFLQVESVFSFFNVSVPIWQPAMFDVNELIDPDTGLDFNLPTNSFPVKVSPGTLPGDLVNVEVVLSIERGEVVSAEAVLVKE